MTQHDVARAANVSIMTVSNVLHGKTGLVSEATRTNVLKTIRNLNYRPNVSAQRLRVAREGTIGFVIVDADPAFLSDPLIGQLVSGLSNFLSRNDYVLDIQGMPPDRFTGSAILNNFGNDAICALLSGPKEVRAKQVEFLKRIPQPMVIFQETMTPSTADIAVIRQDDMAGGTMVAQHLVTRDIRTIVFLRPAQIWSSVEQKEIGIRSVLCSPDQNIDFSVLSAPSEFFEDVFVTVKEYVAKTAPHGIIAATDAMAIAAIRACQSEGLRVPEDVKVTGFSGYDHWRVMVPSLTTIVSPAYEMGRFAGELLLKRLKTGKFDKQTYVFPVSFRAGASG